MAHPVEPKSPWLAISFGCCASRRDSIDSLEDEGQKELKANGEAEMQICYNQPQPLQRPRAQSMHPRPTTSHSLSQHVSTWAANSRDFASRASSRASVHTLTRPKRSQSKSRPIRIGRPMDFRHTGGLDSVDGIQKMLDEAPMPIRRRRSFSLLELSIYLPENRLSDLPDFMNIDWDTLPSDLDIPAPALVREKDSRTNSLTSNPSTSSYLLQRKPVGTGSRRSSVSSQASFHSRPASVTLSTLPFVQEEQSRPESFITELPNLTRTNTQASQASPRILSRLPSPSRGRSNTAPSRPGSLRRARSDVDEAIRELNTIVEERRADAYRSNNQSPALINRPPLSPSHHVPAIAPSLRMHVRSETLSDIGSAFSAPLAFKPLPNPPNPPASSGSASSHKSRHSRAPTKLSIASTPQAFEPLRSNPITPTTPIGRLGAWLKKSLPNTPATPSFFKSSSSPPTQTHPSTPKSSAPTTPFYQCEPNTVPLPPTSSHYTTSSRPSTAGSRTLAHTRQTSNETATVTLFSTSTSIPSTPALSTRSLSPRTSEEASPKTVYDSSPSAPARLSLSNPRINLLKGHGAPLTHTHSTSKTTKVRRIPAPLTLAKEKELAVEAALGSARSASSVNSFASYKSYKSHDSERTTTSARQSGSTSASTSMRQSMTTSARQSARQSLKPPQSPNYNLLRGMEIPIRPKGASAEGALPRGSLGPSPVSPVGVAF